MNTYHVVVCVCNDDNDDDRVFEAVLASSVVLLGVPPAETAERIIYCNGTVGLSLFVNLSRPCDYLKEETIQNYVNWRSLIENLYRLGDMRPSPMTTYDDPRGHLFHIA